VVIKAARSKPGRVKDMRVL